VSFYQFYNHARLHRPAIKALNACEADEDIPYLGEFIGDDPLMIGSDYGYNDPAEEKALGPDNEIARRSFGRIG